MLTFTSTAVRLSYFLNFEKARTTSAQRRRRSGNLATQVFSFGEQGHSLDDVNRDTLLQPSIQHEYIALVALADFEGDGSAARIALRDLEYKSRVEVKNRWHANAPWPVVFTTYIKLFL